MRVDFQSSTVKIPDELVTLLKNFRKSTARKSGVSAQVVKVNMKTYELEEVEQLFDLTVEELVEGS